MNATTTDDGDDGMTAGQYVLTALLALGVLTVMVGAVLYGSGVIDGSTLPAIQDGSDRPDTLPGTDDENESTDLNDSDDSSNPSADDSDGSDDGTDDTGDDSSSSDPPDDGGDENATDGVTDPAGDEPDENNSSDQEYPIDVGGGDGDNSSGDANETLEDPNVVDDGSCEPLPGTDPNRTRDPADLPPGWSYCEDDPHNVTPGGNATCSEDGVTIGNETYTNRSIDWVADCIGDGNGTAGDDEWTDAERREAERMLREYYAGYKEGIDHSMSTEIHYEAESVGPNDTNPGGQSDPWPLEEWDSVEEAREDGAMLGSGEGAEPFGEDYHERHPGYDSDSDNSSANSSDNS